MLTAEQVTRDRLLGNLKQAYAVLGRMTPREQSEFAQTLIEVVNELPARQKYEAQRLIPVANSLDPRRPQGLGVGEEVGTIATIASIASIVSAVGSIGLGVYQLVLAKQDQKKAQQRANEQEAEAKRQADTALAQQQQQIDMAKQAQQAQMTQAEYERSAKSTTGTDILVGGGVAAAAFSLLMLK
jgi:uncharacterized protein HemX